MKVLSFLLEAWTLKAYVRAFLLGGLVADIDAATLDSEMEKSSWKHFVVPSMQ